MRLLGAVRLSHLTDETASPETQRTGITKYAEFKNAELIAIAEDLDVSGAVSPFERDELGPWLTDPAKIAQYDGIIVHKLDRLSRSLLDFQTLLIWCQEHSKTIISVSEGIDFSNPIGKLLANMLIMFAEFERERMRERRTERAVTDRKNGYVSYGPAFMPYGYTRKKVNNHFELVPEPEQRQTVNWIADQCIAGKSAAWIASDLTRRNIPSARGGKWTSTIVLTMMRNPVIRGYVIAQSKAESRGTRQIVRGEDGMPVRREALISDDKWLKLQVALETNSRPHSGIRHGASLLLRIAYCSSCEQPLYINRRVRDGKLLGIYYRHASGNACKEPQIKAELLEPLVESELLRAVGDVPMMEKIIHEATDHTAELAEVETSIADLMADRYERNLYSASTGAEMFAAMMGKLEARREALASLPVEPETVEYVPTGKSYSQYWESMDTEARHQFLLNTSVRAYVERSEDEEAMPWPDPDGRVVTAVGLGWRVTIHLGDLAELREMARAS